MDFSNADAAVNFASQAQHPLYSQATTELAQLRDEIRAGLLGVTVEAGQDAALGGIGGVGVKAGLREVGAQSAKSAFKVRKPLSASVDRANRLVPANVDRHASFSAFKRAHGSAGKGMEWHHIVEQNPANVSQFGAEALHNLWNVIALDAETHRKISGYYSSKQSFTGGKRVRDWLATQPLQTQREFGLETLERFGVVQ